jgi:hypothetical protein
MDSMCEKTNLNEVSLDTETIVEKGLGLLSPFFYI